MFQVIITIDYEIHGNGDGCPYKLMIEPTYRMMKLFDQYGAKLTIMADVAEILKFKEYKEVYGKDKYYYDEVIKQLQYAITSGHDVQLHIHSGYFKSHFTEKGIKQEWDEYDLASLPYDLINDRISVCKEFLETNLKEVDNGYECIAFRASNWSMMPTENIYRALVTNGIKIDSSVFKWGSRNGRVKFDYSTACNELIPWFASPLNICLEDRNSDLLEIPIYCEKRHFWDFISVIRVFRMMRARFHKHEKYDLKKNQHFTGQVQEQQLSTKQSPSTSTLSKLDNKLRKMITPLVNKHAWKLDINQVSGKQLINTMGNIKSKYALEQTNMVIPIVLIGHSKSFIKYNERTLGPFLKHISINNTDFKFSRFSDISINSFRERNSSV